MLNSTFTSEVVNFVVSSFTGNHTKFHTTLDSKAGPHPIPHQILGGDMGGACLFGLAPPKCVPGPKWASNDHTFFLHHATIDKVWYDWQHRDPSNKNAFAGGTVSWQDSPNESYTQYPTEAPPFLDTSSVIPSDGLWETTTVGDVLDTVGGRLCYVYE